MYASSEAYSNGDPALGEDYDPISPRSYEDHKTRTSLLHEQR